jgi:hypothetical protein
MNFDFKRVYDSISKEQTLISSGIDLILSIILPWPIVWSLNILFSLSIPYTWQTYLAVSILYSVLAQKISKN